MRCKILDGPLEGMEFETPVVIEKMIVQSLDGVVYRYEYDQDLDDGNGEYQRLVITTNKEEFDSEFREDEQ